MNDGLAQLLGIVLKCVIRKKKSTKSTGHSPSAAKKQLKNEDTSQSDERSEAAQLDIADGDVR